MNYNKILVINLGGIGDILLSTPALRAIRSRFPGSEISVLVVPRVRQIAESLSYINRVFIFNLGYAGRIPLGKVFGNIMVLFALRRERFDLALNMRTLGSKKSAGKFKFLLDIIKAKRTAGRDTQGWGGYYDIKIPETQPAEKFDMEYNIDTAAALGVQVTDRSVDLKVDDTAYERIEKMLEGEGIGRDALIVGIHPGGAPFRSWPIENFASVIGRISNRSKAAFVVTGGKDEFGLAEALKRMSGPKVVNLAGRLDIAELCALIKRCSLYISNDTGPMHIAAVIGTPLVAIFGPGDLKQFDPRNISNKAEVLYKKAECAPCGNFNCSRLECLKAVTPDDVVSAAFKLIRQSG